MKPLEMLDKIEVTHEDLVKINEWVGKNEVLFKVAEPILKEGIVVEVNPNNSKANLLIYFNNVKDGFIQFKIFDLSILPSAPLITFNAKNLLLMFGQIMGDKLTNNFGWVADDMIIAKVLERGDKDKLQKAFVDLKSSCLKTYLNVIAYSQFFRQNITYSSNRATSIKSNTSSKKKQSKRKIKLTKTYKLNVPDKSELLKRPYERHTMSWSVAGHWRTLRNGKRVFIKPYTKGDKDKVIGKTYTV